MSPSRQLKALLQIATQNMIKTVGIGQMNLQRHQKGSHCRYHRRHHANKNRHVSRLHHRKLSIPKLVPSRLSSRPSPLAGMTFLLLTASDAMIGPPTATPIARKSLRIIAMIGVEGVLRHRLLVPLLGAQSVQCIQKKRPSLLQVAYRMQFPGRQRCLRTLFEGERPSPKCMLALGNGVDRVSNSCDSLLVDRGHARISCVAFRT